MCSRDPFPQNDHLGWGGGMVCVFCYGSKHNFVFVCNQIVFPPTPFETGFSSYADQANLKYSEILSGFWALGFAIS